MHDNRVGRRYAQALFETARAHSLVDAVESDLATIARLLASDVDFRHFLLAPDTSREGKHAILEKVFGDRVTALTLHVLKVMLDKRREPEIPTVYEEFVKLRRAANDVMHVVITSAYEIEEDQRRKLIDRLTRVLVKTVEPEYHVDPSLVGGIRVAYDNYILDGSVKGQLDKLRERLRYNPTSISRATPQ